MKNIYLVGFMGTGKTAVGKLLASCLKKEFVEMDEVIEKEQRKKIVDIFAQDGEEHFRNLERQLLETLSQKEDLVVSCGGGVVCKDENLSLLKKTGVVFTLNANEQTIYQRIKSEKHRPLLNVDNPLGKITELLNKRRQYYIKADYVIDTDNLTVKEVIDKIVNILNNG